MGIEPEQAAQLEYILGYVPVGVAILDATSLHFRYANPYLLSLLEEPWRYQGVVGHRVDEVIPTEVYTAALPLLQQVASTGQRIQYSEVPYEGFLETRGRTYWRISIEHSPILATYAAPLAEPGTQQPLLVTIEDVTDSVRSRLHLNAIHHISSAIANASALPLVLDRILQALQEMVGSRRCAVFLTDNSTANNESRLLGDEEAQYAMPNAPLTATVAAQKNVHPRSQDWHPLINEQLLLGRVMRERRTLIITDTSTHPEIVLPYLDDHGEARRPGSVLCVPIFEPYSVDNENLSRAHSRKKVGKHHTNAVLGTIEVYHIRARSFPEEEVKLLERFSQQAGLAIHNARLFRSIDRLARVASRNAHQKENVMQAIPDGVVIFDPRWRVADANHAARKLFGWTDKVIGMTIMQAMRHSPAKLLPGEGVLHDPDPIAELERRSLVGQTDEVKMIGADGQSYTMRRSYTPIRDDLGDIFAFIIIYHDMTREAAARERIEAEVIVRTAELAQRNEALQLAKAAQELTSARMELLLERLPSGVMLISAEDNTITLINRRAIQLLQSMGLSLEPLDDLDEAARNAIGMDCLALLNGTTLYGASGTVVPYEARPFYRALTKGEACEAELHTAATDGQALYVLFNAAPLRAPDGTIMSVILVMHETTTIKALERAREDFFTTMAHELKTPLANIRAHVSALLARDLEWSGEEQHDFLQTADEQVERLVGMVNHFLDASRVEAGALRLEREPILLPEMIEDLQDRLEALISSSKRQLQVVLPPQLPAVVGDYELIISVLTNLLSNAFRYAPEGDTVRLEIEPIFSTQDQSPMGVTLSVIDRGPGLSEEQQQALFTRFSTFAAMHRPAMDRPGQPTAERRRGTARWSPATGLGLYISRGIIEAHGSKLIVKSSPGQGATFAFTLPVFTGTQEQSHQATIPYNKGH
ncbi:MAG: PAS domain-containing protein [Chloroflexi bacterium]|nr:PAS domain-containing protein [Chloroflexota bacterium]